MSKACDLCGCDPVEFVKELTTLRARVAELEREWALSRRNVDYSEARLGAALDERDEALEEVVRLRGLLVECLPWVEDDGSGDLAGAALLARRVREEQEELKTTARLHHAEALKERDEALTALAEETAARKGWAKAAATYLSNEAAAEVERDAVLARLEKELKHSSRRLGLLRESLLWITGTTEYRRQKASPDLVDRLRDEIMIVIKNV